MQSSSFEQTWVKLSPLHKMMICAKSGLKLAQWFWRRRFFKFDVFLEICNYLPFEQNGLFIWTHSNLLHPRIFCAKFRSNWPNGSGEEDFICQNIFRISQLSPLGKRKGHSIKQTWIPFTKRWFVPSLVEIGTVVLVKMIFQIRQYIFAIL